MYLLELGPSERTIAQQAVRAGQAIPERIANAPELRLGLGLYVSAFFELENDRPNNGFGPSGIPWSSLMQYARVFEFDEEEREDLFFIIRAMDAEYLKRVNDKIKASNKGKSKGSKRRG